MEEENHAFERCPRPQLISFYISQLGFNLAIPYSHSTVLYFETSQRRKDLLALTSQSFFKDYLLFLHVLSALLFNTFILSMYPSKFTMNEWAYHLIKNNN